MGMAIVPARFVALSAWIFENNLSHPVAEFQRVAGLPPAAIGRAPSGIDPLSIDGRGNDERRAENLSIEGL